MYIGRKISELNNLPISEWDMKELAYYHENMSHLADFLNQQGVSIHHKIIEEIQNRGGVPKSTGAWDHSSQIIYD